MRAAYHLRAWAAFGLFGVPVACCHACIAFCCEVFCRVQRLPYQRAVPPKVVTPTPSPPCAGFDPLSFSKGDYKGLKQKEIKNGRLAMLAFLGFVAQHNAQPGSPLDQLGAWLGAHALQPPAPCAGAAVPAGHLGWRRALLLPMTRGRELTDFPCLLPCSCPPGGPLEGALCQQRRQPALPDVSPAGANMRVRGEGGCCSRFLAGCPCNWSGIGPRHPLAGRLTEPCLSPHHLQRPRAQPAGRHLLSAAPPDAAVGATCRRGMAPTLLLLHPRRLLPLAARHSLPPLSL